LEEIYFLSLVWIQGKKLFQQTLFSFKNKKIDGLKLLK